jgi:CHAT domain-containing protein
VTLATLQTTVLTPNELLLDAFLGREVSFLFAVTREECRVHRLPGTDGEFGEALNRYRLLLTRPMETAAAPAGARAEAASRGRGGTEAGGTHALDAARDEDALRFLEDAGANLGRLLLGPLAELVSTHRRILFVPDGPLNLIPLCALSLDAGREDVRVPGSGSPLVESHEITRVPSATLLSGLRAGADRPASPTPSGILAVGGAEEAEGRPLPGAREEVRRLDRRYAGVDLRLASHRNAALPTPEELSRYQVLHLASHVSIDDRHPWRSGIELAPPEAYLRAAAIAELELPARLAVLSGCASAGGKILSGEGVLGLTGAFAAAGVPAIVATLWPVSDRATARLMESFYRALARGAPAAVALREAQLALRHEERTRHPYYWAGFILLGDGNVQVRISEKRVLRPLERIFVMGVLAGILALGLGSWRRFRRRARDGQ